MSYYLYRILIVFFILSSLFIDAKDQNNDSIIKMELPVVFINDTAKPILHICIDSCQVTKIRFTATDYGIYNHPLEFIKGKLPALYISSISGSPGSDYSINSMGFNSVKGNTNSSILLNGLPIDNYVKFINYQDIDIYSTQFDDTKYPQFSGNDANGLLTIKTKVPDDDFHVFFSCKSALSWLPHEVDVLSSDEFRNLLNQQYSTHPEILAMAGNSSTNWQKEITRTGFTHDAYISAELKKGKFPMRFSYGNSKTEGIIRNSELTKNTLSFILTPSFLKDNLLTELNLFYTDYNENKVDENAFASAIFFAPTSPVHEDNSFENYFAWNNEKGIVNQMQRNPVALINQLHSNERTSFLSTSLKLGYKFRKVDGLTSGINVALIHLTQNQSLVLDTNAAWYTSSWNDVQLQTKILKAFLNPYLRFEKPFKENLYSIFVEGGFYEHYDKSEDFNGISGKSLSYLSYSEMSAYTTASIRYNKLYTLQAKLTIDNNPWYQTATHLYPAISGLWNFGNEKFMEWTHFLTDLNIYSSFSISGNSPLSQTEQFTIPDNLNPSKSRKFNTGINGVIKKLRLGFSINYYNNFNQNVYFTRSNYFEGGYIEELINSFSMRNSGMILGLNFSNMYHGDMRCNIALSLNYNKNRITDFDDLPGINVLYNYNSVYSYPPMIYYSGISISSFCVKQQKYDSEGKPIEGSYEQDGAVINGNKTEFRTDLSALPDIIAGINGNIRYKDFEFLFSGRFISGNFIYNRINALSVYNDIDLTGNYLRNLTPDIYNTGFYDQQFYADYYLENASFFKMDIIGLGYSFDNIRNKGYNLKITAAFQNAFTITKYSGIDPEVTGGFDNGQYPRARTVSLGVIFEY